MSAESDNLRVVTNHVDELAAKQVTAAGTLKIAGETVNDLGPSVRTTHGVACMASNLAVNAVESARDSARSTLWHMSHDLAERLKLASSNYNDSDWVAGRDIDSCEL